MILLRVKLAIRQSGSLQLERGHVFAEVAPQAGRGWGAWRNGKKGVLIFAVP